MIDHVTLRVPAMDEARRFYDRALGLLGAKTPHAGGGFVDWGDLSLAEATAERPSTRRVHLGFHAASPAAVDAWWEAMTGAGHPSDGAPGLRPAYGEGYYGAFVVDPCGNSVEAVHDGPRRQEGLLDHVWVRVRSLEASARFYASVCPAVGVEVESHAGLVLLRGGGALVGLVEGPVTEGLHLAWRAPTAAAVEAFHAAGVAAGFRSNGAPGERPEYHPGYVAAFLLDPDGTNVEAVDHGR